MDEADIAFLSLRSTEEPEDEAELPEDPALAALQAEVDADTREFEAESWSLAVDAAFAQAQGREVARRQDVLYELMQTEARHVRTLKLTQRVFARALRAAGAAGAAGASGAAGAAGSVLPGARELLALHARFLAGLKRRRREGLQPGSARNYVIARVGDVLLRQFSGERAAALEDAYGAFCCGHRDAVTRYQTLLQRSRRFRDAVRRIVSHPVARRLGVQECVLLITQRITKYPVLVERLLQHTEAGTEEHADLTRALRLLRDAIARVDVRVSECERARRLREIAARVDPRACARLPGGRHFRRDDLLGRKLRLDGTLGWRAASGRVKEVLAVLLSDALLLLQEKDQKLVFASVDGKPAAVALRRLLVREAAHAAGAMFLISAAGPGPEMYELHAASRDERAAWMTHIRGAAESLAEEEEEEEEQEEDGEDGEDGEDRDQDPEGPGDQAASDAFALKLRDFRERLARKDRVIAQSLLEKQRIFLEMAGAPGGGDPERPGGLFRAAADPDDAPRAEHLLRAALSELEGIQSLLCRRRQGGTSDPGDQEDVKGREEGPRDDEDEDGDSDEDAEQQEETGQSPEGCAEEELVLRVQTLSRLLLGLQAAVARQDSALEAQRARLRAGEERREHRRRREEEEEEHRRREREREELRREREELERGRELYQRDLQRLREAQRRLERQREELRRRGSTPGSPRGEALPPAAPPPPPGPAPPEARARGDVPPSC